MTSRKAMKRKRQESTPGESSGQKASEPPSESNEQKVSEPPSESNKKKQKVRKVKKRKRKTSMPSGESDEKKQKVSVAPGKSKKKIQRNNRLSLAGVRPNWKRVKGVLPKRACLLACSYIPTLLLLFREIHPNATWTDCWSNFIDLLIHGVFQVVSIDKTDQKLITEDDWKEVKALKRDRRFMKKFTKYMPSLHSQDRTSFRHVRHELRKHLPHLPFLTPVSYLRFAIRIFRHFRIRRLMRFVTRMLVEVKAHLISDARFDDTWKGVRLGDLIDIAHSYEPLKDAQMSLQLYEWDKDANGKSTYLLKEIQIGITESGSLAENPSTDPYTVLSHLTNKNTKVTLSLQNTRVFIKFKE